MNGKILNGPMILHLCESYVKSFNDGGVPTISTAWDRVVASQCEEVCFMLLLLVVSPPLFLFLLQKQKVNNIACTARLVISCALPGS